MPLQPASNLIPAHAADLRRRLVECLGPALGERTAALMRPAIIVEATPGTVPVGGSRFGGGADLPIGAAWPLEGDEPLMLAAQLDCAELRAFPVAAHLPRAGVLQIFFNELASQQSFELSAAVRYWTAADGPLHRRLQPDGPDPRPFRRQRLPEHRLAFSPTVSLPYFDSAAIRALKLSRAERIAYADLWMEHLPHGTGKQTHQLFGWPVLIQNDFLPAESTADPLAPALFLQLASFHDPKRRIDVSWGDAGYLFFAISPEALATRRFAAMTGELQCT